MSKEVKQVAICTDESHVHVVEVRF